MKQGDLFSMLASVRAFNMRAALGSDPFPVAGAKGRFLGFFSGKYDEIRNESPFSHRRDSFDQRCVCIHWHGDYCHRGCGNGECRVISRVFMTLSNNYSSIASTCRPCRHQERMDQACAL